VEQHFQEVGRVVVRDVAKEHWVVCGKSVLLIDRLLRRNDVRSLTSGGKFSRRAELCADQRQPARNVALLCDFGHNGAQSCVQRVVSLGLRQVLEAGRLVLGLVNSRLDLLATLSGEKNRVEDVILPDAGLRGLWTWAAAAA